jgi:hypothetical protein
VKFIETGQRQMLQYTRKSVRQTLWIGLGLMAVAIVWFIGSIVATPSLSPDAHAWVSLLPAALLALGGCTFLGTWIGHLVSQLSGIVDPDEDDPQP